MPSRRALLTAAGTAGLASVAGCTGLTTSQYTPGTDATTEWPMPAYDRGFSAYNPDAAAPREDVTTRWSTELSGLGASARPVVAGGRVFVPTAGALVALDLASGDEQWRRGEERPWPTAPVVHDGTAYVGFADEARFVALDVETGDEQWRIETRGSIQAAPTFDHGRDTLYLGDDTGRVYRIDPATGEVTLRGEVFGPVTALAHGRSLLVGTEGGEVYDLFVQEDTFTGLWRRKVDGWVRSLAVARDGGIYVGTFGGPAYRLQDGAEVGGSRWEVPKGGIHIAATGGDVIGSDGAGLQAVDARSGSVRWERDGNYGAAPAIAGDTVYVGGGEKGEDGNGFIAAYALAGGVGLGPVTLGGKRWRVPLESAVTDGVAVADGAVFGITQGLKDAPARVYALEAP